MKFWKRFLIVFCSAVGVVVFLFMGLLFMGGTSDHLSSLDMHLIPGINNFYDLGSATKHWRKIFVDEIEAATPLDVNINGVDIEDSRLSVMSKDYFVGVSEGDIVGHTSYTKLGYNADVDTTEEDIWTQGGIYIFPTAEQQMELVSSSVEDDPVKADTSAGTGIWSVRIYYLDDAYTAKTEDINLNGTGVVTTVASDIFRVNALRALTCGTGAKAAGTIVIRNLADTPVYRDIFTGYTRGRGAIYTVPVDKTLYITSIAVSSGYSTVGKNVRWTARSDFDDISGTVSMMFAPFFEIQTQDSAFQRVFEIPVKIPAKSTFKISAIGDSDNSVCTASIRGWEED